ncbi:luciferase family protein [Haladaptatus pallidirubidus]|uniref:Luciferase domain-containing protein n=1 Tax=Haladaptatus pallidirubidus TaxID=1008152 RepID=A0AAV3UQG1_9EURY|nr:luciferase family protein [Haladaptatus pallidirubidus]
MENKDTQERGTSREQITEIVSSWPGISVDEGRFNSTSFKLAGREIGHLHPRLADIDYPRSLRNQLIADGLTEQHHAVPEHPNATTFHIESADDIDHVAWLFRLSYLIRVAIQQEVGKGESESVEIDIQKGLDELAPSNTVRNAFEAALVG